MLEYFLKNNPYRILGLTIDAGEKLIERKLRQYEYSLGYHGQFFGYTVEGIEDNKYESVEGNSVRNSMQDIFSKLRYAQYWFTDPYGMIKGRSIDAESLYKSYDQDSVFFQQNRLVYRLMFRKYDNILQLCSSLYDEKNLSLLFAGITTNRKLINPVCFEENIQLNLVDDESFNTKYIPDDGLSESWRFYKDNLSHILEVKDIKNRLSTGEVSGKNVRKHINSLKQRNVDTWQILPKFRKELACLLLNQVLYQKNHGMKPDLSSGDREFVANLVSDVSVKNRIERCLNEV